MSRYISPLALLAAIVLPLTSSASADGINGTVSKVRDDSIEIQSTSELLPVVGDKLEVFVQIPNVGKAIVATGTVTEVDGDAIAAEINNATGRVAAGQLVVIASPNPRQRPPSKVPVLVGRSAADAKKAIENAGFVARIEVGVDAPAQIKPFTVYAQDPAVNARLARGGTVTITLYGGERITAATPSSQAASTEPTSPPEDSPEPVVPADLRDRRFPPSARVRPGQPWLGVSAENFDDESYLIGVLSDGPAGKAGLRTGDVILSLGDQKVDSVFCARQRRLVDAIGHYAVGQQVPVVCRRNGKKIEVNLTLEPMPPDGGNGRFLAAAGAGEAWAMQIIGRRYLAGGRGKGTYFTNEQQDVDLGLEWLRRSIQAGCPDAAKYLAGCYRSGAYELEKNPAKAVELYRQARELSENKKDHVHRSATVELAEMYLEKEGAARDKAQGAALFRELADSGCRIGAYELGKLYTAGRGVPKNEKQAMHWYYTAANAGHGFAQTEMGQIAYYGRGVQRNYETAAAWFKKAEQNEQAFAKLYLGEMHQYGRGVPKDLNAAISWYRKTADAAYASSTLALARYREGVLYEESGSELGYDAAAARRLAIARYREAAKYNENARNALKRLGVTAEAVTITGWGEVIDPDGDSTIRADGGKLTITVTGGLHDLWPSRAPSQRFNAPRVLQLVNGDFVAQVKVTADWKPYKEDTNYGAGLFVWHAESDFLRCERHVFMRDGRPTCYTGPMCVADSQWISGKTKTGADDFFKGRSTWLRLERSGDTMTSSISHDGINWNETETLVTHYPRQLRVGVHAMKVSPGEFTAEFEDYRIAPRGREAVAPMGKVIDPTGDNKIAGDSRKLTISLPAGVYDMWYGRKDKAQRYTAPRVLQEVTGDFVIQVKVTADCNGPVRGDKGMARAAGLLVYESDQHYLRHERNRFINTRGTAYSWYPPLYDRNERRLTQWKSTLNNPFRSRSTWLRIGRTGQTMTTAISDDGRNWTNETRVTTHFPKTVHVGVLALNNSAGPYDAVFEDFRLDRK